MGIIDYVNQYKEGIISTEELLKHLKQLYTSEYYKSELSSGQKGLWILHKFNPESTAYNLPVCFTVQKKLETSILKRTFSYLAEQYPIIKAVIQEENGTPYQVILPDRELVIEEIKVDGISKEELLIKMKERAKEPFDLKNGPLMKVFIYQQQEKSTLMILVHHIIFDGTSIELFIDSLLNFYYELSHQGHVTIKSIPVNFFDYVKWESQMVNGERGKEHLEYWKKQLEGNLPVLELPVDYTRKVDELQQGKTESINIIGQLADDISKYTRKHKITIATFFLGVWKIILYQYTGQKDIITGMVYRGRPLECFETAIGYFINMIPVRYRILKELTIPELFKQLQIIMFDGMEHGDYPFPNIVRDLKIPRNIKVNPIIQTGYYYQNYNVDETEEAIFYRKEYPIEMIEEIQQEGEYDLTMEVIEKNEGYLICLKYNENLFKQSTIKRIIRKIVWLAKQCMLNDTITVDDIPMLSEEEETVIHEWNDTKQKYPSDKCVYDLFMDQVKQTPDAVAIVFEDQKMTYRDLDDKSTKLAVYLQSLGVKKNSLVGISTQRSFDMMVGLLGILKAGGAYIPLDPLYPKERLEYMIDNSNINIIISHSSIRKKIGELFEDRLLVVSLDEQWEEIEKKTEHGNELKKISGPDDLAYVLYTSGSTGKPKGVMIPHKALTNFLIQMAKSPGLTKNDRLLAITTFCFDISGLELYLPLLNGATCYLLSDEKQKNLEKLKEEIERIRPTIMQATPATWNALFKVGFKNKEKMKILCGGEALPEKLKKLFMDSDSEVWNMFGPTETTIWSTMKRITRDEPVTIGKPIANTQLYVLNNEEKPVPIGVPGELYIGGDGLAKGYLFRDDLTNERFVKNPFNEGTRLYRTGDIVKWLDNGEIEYLGRADNQVKIRGYRIELDEIENRMNMFPGIHESVVISSGEDSNRLQAFFLKTSQTNGKQVDIKELRDYLNKWLPPYMIPSSFSELSQIPLTPNGKVNRLVLNDYKVEKKAESILPEFSREKTEQIEEIIAVIWEECLGHSDFAVQDGFFSVGGDSITAVTVVEKINNKLGINLTVTNLFEYSTIDRLSKYISESMYENHEKRSIKISTELNVKKNDEKEIPDYYKNSVAIIGVSLNVPGAETLEQFWKNLIGMKESCKFLTKEEQLFLNVPVEIMEDPNYVPVQFGIDGREFFDAGFFKISPKDAELMNPQLRMLLQASWSAVEDAGYISTQIPNTAVYISASNNGYLSEGDGKKASIMDGASSYVKWLYDQCGTIPTLISYKLGFKGPSYFVHSNCSSGLVGMYQAYQSICSGRTDYALVGASTLHSHPDAGYVHVSGLNLSGDGHIKAFDSSADGMVAGEGTAVLLMKNAKMAVEDGDHIYGILRGIEITNDGTDKVGFYAPSVIGQTEVIERTLESTKINPETINYVETHGTGTKLGDPIEFKGLCNAYRKYTSNVGFCGIGSVKTNIGHLDTVSGIIGCIKIMLSFINETLPASLNFKKSNEEIDFDNSPFYIVDQPKKLMIQELPYRAALSSFGIGGTNVHAIFEQCKQDNILKSKEDELYLIALSAQTDERLKVYAEKLLSCLNTIENWQNKRFIIQNIEYTLLTGRTAMNKRIVFIVNNKEELFAKLSQFVNGEERIELFYKKSANKDNKISVAKLDQWLLNKNKEELAQAWVEGAQIDWNLMYTKDDHVYKISLPTYPFLKERYWIETQENVKENVSINRLHALIDENHSSFNEQKYTKKLVGTEFYLEDHIINGQKVLPGVIHIEMARAACELAMEKRVCRLKSIILSKPVIVDKSKLIRITLAAEGQRVKYTIRSIENEQIYTHSQGIAEFDNPTEFDDEVFDLEACKEACNNYVNHQEFYGNGNNSAYNYGITFRPIQEMFLGRDEVLSRIEIPEIRLKEFDQYTLHPSLLEGCLQTVVGLMSRNNSEAFMPFLIEEIEIVHPLTKDAYVYATYANDDSEVQKHNKFNLWLLDSQGNVLLKIKRYSVRNIHKEQNIIEKKEMVQSLFFKKRWRREEQELTKNSYDGITLVFEQINNVFREISDEKNMVQVLCGNMFRKKHDHIFEIDEMKAEDYVQLIRVLKGMGKIPKRIIYCLHQENEFLDVAVQQSILRMFYLVRALLQECKSENIKLLVIQDVQESIQSCLYGALSGFISTVNQENKKFFCKVIQLRTDKIYLDEIIHYEFEAEDGEEIRYTDEGRFISTMKEMDISMETRGKQSPFRNKGVYLITGGMGKLGSSLAVYLAKKYHAKLVLLSRSEPKEEHESIVNAIKSYGGEVSFIKADVSKKEEVKNAIKQAFRSYKEIHGVFHCAGIVKDKLIENKTEEEFLSVINGKIMGAVYLDELLKNEQLDFYVMFSSISSLGNAGQSDYACANCFLDEFSEYRAALCKRKQRYGKSLSIGWPLWNDGGMTMSEANKKLMQTVTGMLPLPLEEGMKVLERALLQENNHVIIQYGEVEKIKKSM